MNQDNQPLIAENEVYYRWVKALQKRADDRKVYHLRIEGEYPDLGIYDHHTRRFINVQGKEYPVRVVEYLEQVPSPSPVNILCGEGLCTQQNTPDESSLASHSCAVEPMQQEIQSVCNEVAAELLRAKTLFPEKFVNQHEAYAVILEEIDELWDEIKKNQKKYDLPAQRKEAIQGAAMLVRLVVELLNSDTSLQESKQSSKH